MSQNERRAFAALAKIYARVDGRTGRARCRACGECCRFETFGHRLYATYLEAAYLAAVCGAPAGAFGEEGCGYQRGSLCGARPGRVLGCRTFFCGAAGGFSVELHESALAEIKRLTGEHGLPADYLPLSEHLERLASPQPHSGAAAK